MQLELVPAGRQDSGYAVQVSSFNWQEFYDKLGGGVFLEALKRRLRQDYDFVLIDSRTGISDTSGICTVQMPDELVVLYTPNHQSMKGASAVAESADRLRRRTSGEPGLRIWPVPTRVDLSEKEHLDAARQVSQETFGRYIGHLPRAQRKRYWEKVEVLYQSYYAYEEILATFADWPRREVSMLSKMEEIASLLAREPVELPRMNEDLRLATKNAYLRHSKAPGVEPSQRDARVYISYSRSNSEQVSRIVEQLRGAGVPVWYDVDDLPFGAKWQDEISQTIAACSAMLFVIGPHDASPWPVKELSLAIGQGKPVIPVLVNGAGQEHIPWELRSIHAAILDPSSPRMESSIARLARDVRILLERRRVETAASVDPADPQKGRWGGEPSRNGRVITASVRQLSPDFFELTLDVHATGQRPLEGNVEFHLHPTFEKPVRNVPVVDGRATLKLVCWGAFTAGAVADNGETTLEIDLAADNTFPPTFTSR